MACQREDAFSQQILQVHGACACERPVHHCAMPAHTQEILSMNPDPNSEWKALNDFKGSRISPIIFQTLKLAVISGLF